MITLLIIRSEWVSFHLLVAGTKGLKAENAKYHAFQNAVQCQFINFVASSVAWISSHKLKRIANDGQYLDCMSNMLIETDYFWYCHTC